MLQPAQLPENLTHLGERICQSPEQFKAWSQNLGHEKALTTFTSYGEVASPRQAEIIRTLTAILRRRFDLIAETTAIDAMRKAAGEVSNGLSEIWLPGPDSNQRHGG